MSYVDGFVVPVPTANKEEYRRVATEFAKIFKEFGASSVVECWADDVPRGKLTDFWMSVKAEEGESLIFSWITWPSKEVRDAGNKRMMEDPRIAAFEMPFDTRRMIFGGFEVLLQV